MTDSISLRLILLSAACVGGLFAGCSQSSKVPANPAMTEGTTVEPAARTVTISAAASTKEAIETLAAQFMEQTGAKVQVNLGPSSGLANQILSGAPADLFLSASQAWADKIKAANQAEAEVRLLTNRLVLIVPTGNSAGVREPQDMISDKVQKIALAGENVPAGKYADQALAKLGLQEQLVADGKIARGETVRSALSYVERGEAEAGIVYSTDVAAATGIEIVYEFAPALHDEVVYPLVLLTHANSNPAAQQFYDFLQSPAADAIYTQHGFSRATTPALQP